MNGHDLFIKMCMYVCVPIKIIALTIFQFGCYCDNQLENK